MFWGLFFLCFIVFSWNDEAWLQQDAHRRVGKSVVLVGRVVVFELYFINDVAGLWCGVVVSKVGNF
jgi:hypothetical protein